ncbi:MAG: APC family permease [Desulfobaccales bacterium]
MNDAEITAPLVVEQPTPEELIQGGAKKERLGAWHATAICGNDITSSCLYVSAIAIVYAHALAPVALLLAAGVLYLYRKIYTEVVEALPLDGGAYNCLLNCTRKFDASFAACLTLLSYLATAVISAKTAAAYLMDLCPGLPPLGTTAVVLTIFAGLTILGITDSARVALGIFLLHLATLTLFVIWVIFSANLITHWLANIALLRQDVYWPKALFLGFSAAMLGVSGFESSANYVEQQRPGVFRLTLRNMWLAVTVFNPLIALLALGLLMVPEIIGAKDDLVGQMGMLVGGHSLHTLIVVDAVLVLSGAVLTSYVGVSGLVHRMTLDQCFPQFLLKQTRRGSFPLIIVGFMILCISILYLTGGELLSLAGVYTISFLGVMTLFGIGNILLKVNRPELKRTYRAGWGSVILGVIATCVGILGNLAINFVFLGYFAIYFVPAVLGGIAMYMRIPILKWILTLIDRVLTRFSHWRGGVEERIEAIANIRAVVFVGLGTLNRMLKAFNYLSRNEDCQNVLIFRLYTEDDPAAELNIHRNLGIIRELHPDLKIEYQARKGLFNPEVVDALSKELDIPKNMMFMGSLTHAQTFSIQDLGGVRIIW